MPDIAEAPNKPINDFIRPIPGKLPELFVPAGGQAEADARRYEFSRVTIEEGGYVSLRFNAREALQFVVEGDMVLNGEIYLWNSASEERERNVIFPDGTQVIFAYRNNNRGGDGGTGQEWSPRPSVSGRGGRGARGTTRAGGGGGGGGSATFRDGHGGGWERPTNGENANDDRGAFGGPPGGGTGGDGAERDAYKTGGMLYLRVNGDFDGSGGKIFGNGNNGRNGGDGTLPQSGTSFGGGGGGGPGGNGGFVAIYVSGQVASWPGTDLRGGEGGNGGNPNGGRGEDGASGFAELRAKNPAPPMPAPLTGDVGPAAPSGLALRQAADQQREEGEGSPLKVGTDRPK